MNNTRGLNAGQLYVMNVFTSVPCTSCAGVELHGALWSSELEHQTTQVKSQGEAVQSPVMACDIRKGIQSQAPSQEPQNIDTTQRW